MEARTNPRLHYFDRRGGASGVPTTAQVISAELPQLNNEVIFLRQEIEFWDF